MSVSEALLPAIEFLENQRADIDRTIAMLRSLVSGEGKMDRPEPPRPAARLAPIVTAPPAPKPVALAKRRVARPAAQRSAPPFAGEAAQSRRGRPTTDLTEAIVSTLSALGRWIGTAELAEQLPAPAKKVSTACWRLVAAGRLVRRPGPPGPGDQPRFEYATPTLLGGRAAAGLHATANGRMQP